MITTVLAIVAVPAAGGLALAALYARRAALTRGGTITMSMRVHRRIPGRGWAPGFAKFEDGRLEWYRMFSYAWRPRRTLDRNDLKVEDRRQPEGAERQVFPSSVIILACHCPGGHEVELAMTRSALTGFLSWLEAAPPGAASSRISGR
ncbi:MAG TPA: DUF2550 domain-containing protein [Candidatus Stackebrandtia faecavium]|nr:DUF2550 domain-containing protein [Candidatus Stackebrandtia faecavium]